VSGQGFKAYVPLVVGDSPGCGQDTFATTPIRAGASIAQLGGERIGYKECVSRLRHGAILPDDPLQIGSNAYLHLDDSSHLINHCCEPNAGWRGQIFLVAMRDIPAGEEIHFDYATAVTFEGYGFACQRGTPRCRGRNGGCNTTRLRAVDINAAAGQRFGVSPLIVSLEPLEGPLDLYWYSYPEALKPLVLDAMASYSEQPAEMRCGT